jgi:dihydroflavonol-4-reductase
MPAYVHTGLCFVHVKDVALGHCLAAEKGRVGERYVLGGHNLTMRRFLELVAAACRQKEIPGAPENAPEIRVPYSMAWLTGWLSTGYADWVSKKPPSVPLEAVKMSKRFMFFDSAKAVRELGYSVTPIEEAVSDALDWYVEHRYFSRTKEAQAHVNSV